MTAATMPRSTAKAETPVLTLTMAREALVAALTRAALVSPTKTSLPILTAVKMQRSMEGLVLTTTDLDRVLTSTLAIEGQGGLVHEDSPAVALPVKRLLDIVTQMPPGTVTLTVTGSGSRVQAKLTGGRSRFEVLGFAADEFPLPETTRGISRVRVPGGSFARALGRVVTHVSLEPSRIIQGGVLFEAAQDGLFLVATDTYHIIRERIGSDEVMRGQWIIPRQAVMTIVKLFDAEPTLDIDAEPTRLRFSTASVSLDVRMTGGPYPSYRQVMVPKASRTAIVDRMVLAAAIKRMQTLSEVRSIALNWRSTEVTVSAEKDGAGRAEDVVGCSYSSTETDPDNGFSIGFDPELLLETLSVMPTTDVRMRMGTVTTPSVIEPVGETRIDSLGIVVPIRLQVPPQRAADEET